jgi:hypothetical protein
MGLMFEGNRMTYRSSSELADRVAAAYPEGVDVVRREAFLAISSVRTTPEIPRQVWLAVESAMAADDADRLPPDGALRIVADWLWEIAS